MTSKKLELINKSVKKLYLSLHILSVVLFVDVWPGYFLLDSQPSVSDLDRQT